MSLGKGASKALVDAIRLDASPVRASDADGWKHIDEVVKNASSRKQATARGNGFLSEAGGNPEENPKTQIDAARALLKLADEFRDGFDSLRELVPDVPIGGTLANDPIFCVRLADQLKNAAAAIRLAAAKSETARIQAHFEAKTDRTSRLVQQLFDEIIGIASVDKAKLESVWNGVLQRLDRLKSLKKDFETIHSVTDRIKGAGAPAWAAMLKSKAADAASAPLASTWRDAWDHAAAEAALDRIDARHRLIVLAKEREVADKQCRKLFGTLVRERTFHALERRLSPAVKAALVEFVRALARIGRGTGKGAGRHRRSARDAMGRCYDAVPCWIMPTWRVAEQLPPEIAAIDLVIIDEASQSDVTELPALLRGRKLLVVGDDRQVSPTAPFVTQGKVDQLRHHYLKEMPFKSLLEPGESIYDLMRAVFPNDRIMLKEHFRCVEPIIQFSMQFYPEKMLPLRIPSADECIDPPLVDIFVPHGRREGRRKVNRAEAEVIVDEIKVLTAATSGRPRSIGVISLIGAEQAQFIRSMLSEAIGEELMQRHSILCGDSATFQGTERDVVFLSMVADPVHKNALTMLRYVQRFNVAASRARDRLVLVRSVKREDLQPADLKARLIAHFDEPMPAISRHTGSELDRCESAFERDLFSALLDKRFRVRSQVGSLGYRIDLVVEGADGRRLAIECDGDRFHGPEQWREDMRRQRVLERAGWRFWRCFASSHYLDREKVHLDLFDTLGRMGIQPLAYQGESVREYTERRIIELPNITDTDVISTDPSFETSADRAKASNIQLGDRVILQYADDKRRLSVRLISGANDLENGFLSINSPLGKAILGSEQGDEVEVDLGGGRQRVVLIEGIFNASNQAIMSA